MGGALKIGIHLAAALLCSPALPAAARPPTPHPAVITQPDWVARPDANDLTEHYPEIAAALNLTGRATVACDVDAFGGLETCTAVSETPTGLGFGAAAVAMTPLFRMRPMTRDGQAVTGGKIIIPIAFRLPPGPVWLAPIPYTPDPAALSLARRLLAAKQVKDHFRRVTERQVAKLEFGDDGVTPEATRAAGTDALKTAMGEQLDWVMEEQARVLSRLHSKAELAAAVDFSESSAGAVERPNRDLAALDEMLYRDQSRRAQIAASETFCKTHSCDIAPVLSAEVKATLRGASFSKGPEPDEVARAAPALLRALGLPGAAQLVCRVDDLATPTDCKVAAEAPRGLGVGSAALGLAPRARVHPLLMSQGAEQETVALLIIFPAAEDARPFTPPKPRSARALALAKELVGAGVPADAMARNEGALQVVAATARDADPEMVQAAIAALRHSWITTQTASLDAFQASRAAIYTEEQLAAALAFKRSDAGRAMDAKSRAVSEAMVPLIQAMFYRAMGRAREIYCKDHPCETAEVKAEK